MRPFEDYGEREVKKTVIDKNLAKSLLDQAIRRLAHVDKEPITEENSDFILEDYYESLRTLADAVLALNGYKSYSHEATIAFFANDFSPALIDGFDRLRRLRHGIHYYGNRVSKADAAFSRDIAKILIPKLKQKIAV